MENTGKRNLFYNGKCIHGFLVNVRKQFSLSIFKRKLFCAFHNHDLLMVKIGMNNKYLYKYLWSIKSRDY